MATRSNRGSRSNRANGRSSSDARQSDKDLPDFSMIDPADDRMRMTSYGDSIADHRHELAFRRVPFTVGPSAVGSLRLERDVERFPFVPSAPDRRDERCEEAYRIQVQGLVTRMRFTGSRRTMLVPMPSSDATLISPPCASMICFTM